MSGADRWAKDLKATVGVEFAIDLAKWDKDKTWIELLQDWRRKRNDRAARVGCLTFTRKPL